MNSFRVDVVLPAAGRIGPPFADAAGTGVKALIEFDGLTLLERLITALRESGRVGRIVVIGTPEISEHPVAQLADTLLSDAGSGPANVFAGLQALSETAQGKVPDKAAQPHRVLVATTDLPFVTPQAVSDFLDACPSDAEVSLGVVGKAAFEARFPGVDGEWVRLRDGEWTLGNAFLIDPIALQTAQPHVERVFAARKSQWQMARLLGPLFIARWVGRRLSIPHVQRRCEELLGCRGAAVTAAPEWAFDLDTLDEYRHARRLLNLAQA